MCQVAPLSMLCEFDDVKDKLYSCRCNHMACFVQELKMSLPIIGGLFKPHKCPHFMPKRRMTMPFADMDEIIDGTGKPQTNADRFRKMSDEEQQRCVRGFWEIEDFADWLKQIAEEE